MMNYRKTFIRVARIARQRGRWAHRQAGRKQAGVTGAVTAPEHHTTDTRRGR
jgi:hypothetical protein